MLCRRRLGAYDLAVAQQAAPALSSCSAAAPSPLRYGVTFGYSCRRVACASDHCFPVSSLPSVYNLRVQAVPWQTAPAYGSVALTARAGSAHPGRLDWHPKAWSQCRVCACAGRRPVNAPAVVASMERSLCTDGPCAFRPEWGGPGCCLTGPGSLAGGCGFRSNKTASARGGAREKDKRRHGDGHGREGAAIA